MKLYFARHGESEANVARVMSNRDIPHHLTSAGRAHAFDLANSLREVGLTRIYSSPITRAIETAQTVAEVLGVPFETTVALREFDCGVCEGKGDLESWEKHDALNEAWFRAGQLDARIEGGESFNDIRDRFVPFVENLIATNAESEDSILIVSHGGTMTCVFPELFGNISREFMNSHKFAYAAPIEAVVTNGRLVCIRWNGEPLLGD